MPTSVTTYRCLLISPSDVQEERDAIVRAVESWNAHVGRGLEARIEVVRWESHARPDMDGPPQDVINRQLVDECDFGVAVFWCRLGSPTKNHRSGSAEEIERLLARNANVLVYFSRKPVPQERLRDDQFQNLQELREKYEKRGLYASYDTTEQLVHMINLHFTSLAGSLLTKDRAENQPIPSTGLLTAPKPDVRIKVAGAIGQHGTEVRPFLAVEIQNHSPIDFFFSGITFPLSNDQVLHVTADEVSGPIRPRSVAPGDAISLYFDPRTWVDHLKGAKLKSVLVKDKIGRTYHADPFELIDALESFWQFAER